ncbi:mobile mystery protein B [Rodentibacter pneumotropicus]|uniref:Mobile mystery protein B n=2 Tax=Rodentibacter pneumotropicus TaxID=758 RepID=A0A3S4Y1Q6_9PAST|nr:Fic family protein [Rodentibacter pneumotropicus]MDC2824841.1 Fic family protein [Rodentibacter pneumotropicus]VEH66790.1 mobile mystery protein B [Rodentibacter pneumotropicus]
MMIKQYIWQYENWTDWKYDLNRLLPLLNQAHYQQGLLLGRLFDIGFEQLEQINLQSLTQNVIKSSEIEGEVLNVQSVRSSLARRLGVEIGGLLPIDRGIEGIVEMTLDATTNFHPLTLERLFAWHAALFPTGYSGISKIEVGALRSDKQGAMQVVSGKIGKQKVHFEAPPAEKLKDEISLFLDWLNGEEQIDPFIKSAVAHLWFLTLHPFEDGNGRIARAIADYLLAKAENNRLRFYSLSAQIQKVRSNYYEILENTQKGVSDITIWITWFIQNIIEAINTAQKTLDQVLLKNHYWQKWRDWNLNDRQRKVLNRLLDGFEGNLTNKKYATLTKVSRDTALRDLTDLVNKQILQVKGGGRSIYYEIAP